MSARQFLVICVVFLVAVSQFSKVFTSSTHMQDQHVLLVTAHPDDESMFFGPTVRHVLNNHNTLHFLVLSNGDAEGLGPVRAEEMQVAVTELGGDPENLEVVDDPRLQDGDTWDPAVVAEFVEAALDKTGAETVITFDKHGVSGHQNHEACFNGTLLAADREGLSMLTLYSVPLWRKYLFSLDAIVSRTQLIPQVQYTIIAAGMDYSHARNALVKGHKSQMVWFRQLWSFFSRYMVVNDLGEIDFGRVRRSDAYLSAKKNRPAARRSSGPQASNVQTAVVKPSRSAAKEPAKEPTKEPAKEPAADRPVTRHKPSRVASEEATQQAQPVHSEL